MYPSSGTCDYSVELPHQTNHTETPTHIEPRTMQPMW